MNNENESFVTMILMIQKRDSNPLGSVAVNASVDEVVKKLSDFGFEVDTRDEFYVGMSKRDLLIEITPNEVVNVKFEELTEERLVQVRREHILSESE